MDNDTLMATLVGALIATVPILITSIVQIILHVSESHQKKREAKIQLALELRKGEIKVIEDSIDKSLKLLNNIQKLRDKVELELISHDEMIEKYGLMLTDDGGEFERTRESELTSAKVAYGLGDKFLLEYSNFKELCSEQIDQLLEDDTLSEELEETGSKILYSAGTLHYLLIEKLISVRD